MAARQYEALTDGTQALITQFVKEPKNEENLLKAFNEVALHNALSSKELKNIAIDEFRKDMQNLATKDELSATREALQAKIDMVEGKLTAEISRVESRLTSRIDGLVGRIDGVESELTAKIDGLNGKIDNVETGLMAEISRVESELTAKIDGVESKLTAKIDKVESNLTAQIKILDAKFQNLEKLEARNFRFLAITLGAVILNFIAVAIGVIKGFL